MQQGYHGGICQCSGLTMAYRVLLLQGKALRQLCDLVILLPWLPLLLVRYVVLLSKEVITMILRVNRIVKFIITPRGVRCVPSVRNLLQVSTCTPVSSFQLQFQLGQSL